MGLSISHASKKPDLASSAQSTILICPAVVLDGYQNIGAAFPQNWRTGAESSQQCLAAVCVLVGLDLVKWLGIPELLGCAQWWVFTEPGTTDAGLVMQCASPMRGFNKLPQAVLPEHAIDWLEQVLHSLCNLDSETTRPIRTDQESPNPTALNPHSIGGKRLR